MHTIPGLEINGPMRMGGKCKTGIKRTKNAGVENVGLTKCKHPMHIGPFNSSPAFSVAAASYITQIINVWYRFYTKLDKRL